MDHLLKRRSFLAIGAAAAVTGLARPVFASVPASYDAGAMPPFDSEEKFIAWAVKNRGEDKDFLKERFDRFKVVVANKDVLDERNKRAFLLTPREEFVGREVCDFRVSWTIRAR